MMAQCFTSSTVLGSQFVERRKRPMSFITVKDGTQIYYKDWGKGQPVVFSHGWPLTADAWDAQMLFLASHGYRCIAHDRRATDVQASLGTAMKWTLTPT